jgi:hypothetical protein
MRIVNRQPLNVELLTLDDGTQKIAWDVKHLQSLLGITDLIHREELNSSESTATGVNASGIPTIETVIAILDELGLKDLYEVRYRKQYATIIPKTGSKRPKVAMYVVQQESEIALSIHDRILTNHLARFYWNDYDEYYGTFRVTIELYVPPIEKPEFFGRIIEFIGDTDIDASNFEENSYSSTSGYKIPYSDIPPIIKDMAEQNICYELSSDQRFPSTSRILFSHHSELKGLLLDLVENLAVFLRSNGEKPEIPSNDENNTSSSVSSSEEDFN